MGEYDSVEKAVVAFAAVDPGGKREAGFFQRMVEREVSLEIYGTDIHVKNREYDLPAPVWGEDEWDLFPGWEAYDGL